MALRVLLADESTTIKKVMQLALQDFAVEVKCVPVGLDVLPVTKAFKPDIIFIDVLLTKKSGYDVCSELKSDVTTQNLPIVLMWSSFMELDEAKFASCQANGRLEKPFDADSLRALVETLATKTQSNPTSAYLSFPTLPEFEENSTATPEVIAAAEEFNSENFTVEELNEPPVEALKQDLTPFQLEPIKTDSFNTSLSQDAIDSFVNQSSSNDSNEEDDGWMRQDLTKFKIPVPSDETDNFASKFVIPQDDLSQVQIADSEDYQEVTFAGTRSSVVTTTSLTPPPKFASEKNKNVSNVLPEFNSPQEVENIERIIREEARAAIESIAWKLLPEITERIVREEISRLLRDTENTL